MSFMDAFKKADEVLLNAVQGISDLINHTGLINTDFADVRTIMANKGLALMGTGLGDGEHRAVEAATNAISSPLLEDISVDGATGLIINVTGGPDLTAFEVNEATTLIMEAAHEDAEIIFGSVIDENMKNKVKITVIATGIGANAQINQVIGGGTILDRPSASSALTAGTQAESLSTMARQPLASPVPPPVPAANSPVEMRAPMPPPARSMEAINPSAPAAPRMTAPAMRAEAENIIPSASLAELDAEMDSFSSDDMASSMSAAEEDLPKPSNGGLSGSDRAAIRSYSRHEDGAGGDVQ
jgi:cell division protein FtsZ